MFVAPGKSYTVCMDCNQQEQAEKHAALKQSVRGRRISTSAASFDLFARSLTQYLNSQDNVFVVELGGTARDTWRQPPMPRGETIDKGFDRGNLPYNFPVVDLWDESTGEVTSIKSLDLAAQSYRNINDLDRKVAGFVEKVASYQGNANPRYGKLNSSENIKSRVLLLVVPLIGSREYQLNYLYSLPANDYASRKNVQIVVFIVD